ncbi:MAG: hypothetical protein ACOX4F_03315 [Atopobiaceae bacterium]|jgi:hypothetical protein
MAEEIRQDATHEHEAHERLMLTSVVGEPYCVYGEAEFAPRSVSGGIEVDVQQLLPQELGHLSAPLYVSYPQQKGPIACIYLSGEKNLDAEASSGAAPAPAPDVCVDGVVTISCEWLRTCGVEDGDHLVATGNFDHIELFGAAQYRRIRDEIDATLDVSLYPMPLEREVRPQFPEDEQRR